MDLQMTRKLNQEDSDSDDQDLAYSDTEDESTTDSDSDTHEYDKKEMGKFGLTSVPHKKANHRLEQLPREYQELVREFDEEVATIMKPKPETAPGCSADEFHEATSQPSETSQQQQPQENTRKQVDATTKLWRVEPGSLNEAESLPKHGKAAKQDLSYMFDERSDDRDQRAIDSKRNAYLHPKPVGSSKSRVNASPKVHSDARLDCPGCMTTLCFDSQRHAFYRTQYRAMFVQHCLTDSHTPLKYTNKQSLRKAQAATAERDSDADAVEEVYYAVRCEVCSTQVGVLDGDEVYHFFNVLASHC